MGVGKTSLILLAVAALLSLLVSCGDTVYEAKGGSGGASATTGTINVHVRDGAGLDTFKDDAGVTVTLLTENTPRALRNGAVSFKSLDFGTYEVKIQKEGYATALYTARVDRYDEFGRELETANPGVVNVQAVLYPIDAELTGALTYTKPDGTKDALPAGAKVTLEVAISTNDGQDDGFGEGKYHISKIENRFFPATTVAGGVYSFTNLPAIGTQFALHVKGQAIGGLTFSDNTFEATDLGVSLSTQSKSVAKTVDAYTATESKLFVIGYPLSVKESGELTFSFNEKLQELGVVSSRIKVETGATVTINNQTGAVTVTGGTQVAVDAEYDGDKIKITPKKEWKSLTGAANGITVTLTNLFGESGAKLNPSPFITSTPIAILDVPTDVFKLLSGDVNGVHWLKDSSEAIVFEFNKELDTAKLQAKSFTDEAHKAEIDGNKLILTPGKPKWQKLGADQTFTGTLTPVDGVGSFNFATQTPALTAKVPEKFVDPFVLTTNTIYLTSAEATAGKVLVLDFTDTIDVSDKVQERPSVTVLTSPKGSPFETLEDLEDAIDANAGFEELDPLPTYLGEKINVNPGQAWRQGWTAIVIEKLTSVAGIKLNKDVLYVYVPVGRSFGLYGERDIENVGDDGAILLRFTKKIDKENALPLLNTAITLDPPQPFLATFPVTGGDSIIQLQPFDGGKIWLYGGQNNNTVSISIEGDVIQSVEGDKLRATTDPIVFSKGGGGENLLAGVAVTSISLSTAPLYIEGVSPTTLAGSFAKSFETTAEIKWTKVSAADGYQIFTYDKKSGKRLAEINVGKEYSGNDEIIGELDDTLYANIELNPAKVLGANLYDVVIRPTGNGPGTVTYVGSETVLADVGGRAQFTELTGTDGPDFDAARYELSIDDASNFSKFLKGTDNGESDGAGGTMRSAATLTFTVKSVDKNLKFSASATGSITVATAQNTAPTLRAIESDLTSVTDNDGITTYTYVVMIQARRTGSQTAPVTNTRVSVNVSVTAEGTDGPAFVEFVDANTDPDGLKATDGVAVRIVAEIPS